MFSEGFSHEKNLAITYLTPITSISEIPWFADYDNFLGDYLPNYLTYQQNKKLFLKVKHYFWEDLYLFKSFADQVIRSSVLEVEFNSILHHCHDGEVGGRLVLVDLLQRYCNLDSVHLHYSGMQRCMFLHVIDNNAQVIFLKDTKCLDKIF